MRPAFNPAMPRTWRGTDTVQFGAEPDASVMLTGVDARVRALLEPIDGLTPLPEVVAHAGRAGLAEDDAYRILRALISAGVVHDASTRAVALAGYPQPARDRLAPEVLAAPGAGASPAESLHRRRAAHVRVCGLGRVGSALAALLAASGVGRVTGEDDRWVRGLDTSPAGFRPEQAGRPRRAALGELVSAVAGADPDPAESAGDPDVVVLADRPDPDPGPGLIRRGTPHLYVRADAGRAEVGPFVLPGRSACARCLDLARTERDRTWPQIAASRWRAEAAIGGELVVSHLAAGLACRDLLRHLGGARPATRDGTLSVSATEWQIRRRSWGRHPGCGCAWSAQQPAGCGPPPP
jgi:bacteriocin biosynthesis cyclodehydratase domain-containing protein